MSPAAAPTINVGTISTATPYDQEIARIHKRDDLFKMHTYRDGILADDEARWRTSPLPQRCAGWSEAGRPLGAPGRRVESIIWRGRERLAPGPARRTVTNAARRGPRP